MLDVEKIKGAIEKSGMSQAQVARKLDMGEARRGSLGAIAQGSIRRPALFYRVQAGRFAGPEPRQTEAVGKFCLNRRFLPILTSEREVCETT